ncbi:hypothetical protein [uncultured Polaribacter sp.]|uniref:hypothetical protein n=1 Tax=uncultured Polaribacter sp. TaxID=174711 RepID=UPI0026274108|nr:hypothetical protein [uncultured Polaribacter sp.]
MQLKEKKYFRPIVLILLISQFYSSAQELYKEKNIDTAFYQFTQKPREIAYVHLNKSTYIVNEDIGFTAYLFSKNDKKLSLATKNLYCVIKDKNNTTVKEQLLEVKNGVANNLFKIDSLFYSGEYTFLAYTNWMKNFNEQNFFASSFNVIDPNKTKSIENESISNQIDAQFLPESGHLLYNIRNTVGVILKNKLGYGVPNVTGDIIDEKNEVITSFKVNELGIGRFSIVPEKNKSYTAKITCNDETSIYKLDKIAQNGIILSAIQKRGDVIISIKTNNFTFKNLQNDSYKVTLHNGTSVTSFPFDFTEKTVTKIFKNENLTPGINIFTLFDENNNPIAERMVFNHEGIKIAKASAIKVKKRSDSLAISFTYKNVDTTALNNFSISVLPLKTKSYTQQQNILSQTYLQPYIKGAIENPQFYFKDNSNATKYYLDNLLLTQGWSSYSWYHIFNSSANLNHFFEKGITLKATINNPLGSKYVIYSGNSRKPNYYVLNKNENEFLATDLFPNSEESIRISKIENKGKLVPARLYPQFYPNNIPELNKEYTLFKDTQNIVVEENTMNNETLITNSINEVQEIDEVIIKANLEERRIEKIKSKSFGRAVILSDADRKEGANLATFLNARGFNAFDDLAGNFSIKARGAISINAGDTPVIYLDGMQLFDFSILSNFDMSIIDYIEVNRNGFGEGIRGGAGVVKIFTDPSLTVVKNDTKSTQEFQFPVTFSKEKIYYTPKYQNYNSSFYRSYGVIDWLPINKIDNKNNIQFNIENIQYNSVKIFIEGYSNDGTFISETKEIVLD